MPVLASYEEQLAIVVDFPAGSELQVRQGVAKTKLPNLLLVDGPRRSLGHTGSHPRSSLVLTFDKQLVAEIELRIFVATLREEVLLQNCILGSRKLFGDAGAVLMKINDPNVAQTYFGMMDEAVYASPGLIIMHTCSSSGDWANIMTITAANTPLASVQKMNYRKSNKGGRVFAKAQMLENDIEAARAEANAARATKHEKNRRKFLATVSIQTLEAAGRDELAGKLVEAIQKATASSFNPRMAPGDLKEGEWRMLLSVEGKWIGRIQFQAKDVASIQAVFTNLHGAAVEIDGTSHTVEVLSDFIKNLKLNGCRCAGTASDYDLVLGSMRRACISGADGQPSDALFYMDTTLSLSHPLPHSALCPPPSSSPP